jgi:hypothetical protein
MAMQEALALTWKTLNGRMRNYRMSVILILAWSAALLAVLVLTRSAWALLGLPGLPAIVLLMLGRDQRLVHGWVAGVLERWVGGDLPLGIFAQAVKASPGPLMASRDAMLRLLPLHSGDSGPAAGMAAEARMAAARTSHAQQSGLNRMGYGLAALTLFIAGTALSIRNPRCIAPFAVSLLTIFAVQWLVETLSRRDLERRLEAMERDAQNTDS